MKKISLLSSVMMVVMAVFLINPVSTFAQPRSASMSCTPVHQPSQKVTQLECRMATPESPYFLVTELTLPFHVTRVLKVSSSFSATLGTVYPPTLVANTIFVASVEWGDQVNKPRLQAIPFDTLSFFVETDQSMSDVKKAFAANKTIVSLLSPNPADPTKPFFQTITPDQALSFDNSLIMESVTQYVSPGVLQFLRLGLACYEKSSPQQCFEGILQNL